MASWVNCGMAHPSVTADGEPPAISLRSTCVKNDHRDGERHQAEQFGRGEADVQRAGLAGGGRRVAQRALEERAEHEADARRCGADTDGGETGADDLSRCEIHFVTP